MVEKIYNHSDRVSLIPEKKKLHFKDKEYEVENSFKGSKTLHRVCDLQKY